MVTPDGEVISMGAIGYCAHYCECVRHGTNAAPTFEEPAQGEEPSISVVRQLIRKIEPIVDSMEET